MVDLARYRALPQEPGLHQCLFGYDGGHKLLVASKPIPPSVTRTLLVASDFPMGVSASEGDGDLTGFPVEEIGAYALSTSWNAYEMPRPGCVWTHTILIPFVVLARIENLGVLLQRFRRPRGPGDLKPYTEELSVGAQSGGEARVPQREFGRDLLVALYGQPERSITVIGGVQPEASISTVLAVWSQQWPRLRRSFRFCVRAAPDRLDPPSGFDLQVFRVAAGVIPKSRDGAGRSGFESRLFGNVEGIEDAAGQAWIGVAEEDLRRAKNTEFRAFLRRFGADVTGGRRSFAGLASAYVACADNWPSDASPAVGRVLVKRFGARSEAGRLKQAFLSGTLGSEHADAASLIGNLLDLESWFPNALSCFDPASLDEALTRALDRLTPDGAWALVMRIWKQSEMPLRQQILSSAARMTRPDEAVERAEGCWGAFLAVVGADEMLSLDARTWGRPLERRALLSAASIGEVDVIELLALLVRVDDQDLAHSAIRRFEAATIDLLLAPSVDSRRPARAWVEEAVRQPAEVLGRTSFAKAIDIRMLEAVVSRWGIDDSRIQSFGNAEWAAALEKASGELPLRSRHRVAALLFAMAVTEPSPGSEALIGRFFDELYLAAVEGLDDDTWRLIDSRLPGYWSRHSWDRCYRLQVAVCRAYLTGRLVPSTFLTVTYRKEVLGQLVAIMNEQSGADRFLALIKEQLQDSQAAST